MDQDQIIIIAVVVAALALVAIAAAVVLAKSRRQKTTEANRVKAGHMRAEATADTRTVDVAALEASEARNHAERRRLEADISETEAADAERRHALEQAQVEDQVRAADRIDPEVDHRAKDYRPTHVDSHVDADNHTDTDTGTHTGTGTAEQVHAQHDDTGVTPPTTTQQLPTDGEGTRRTDRT